MSGPDPADRFVLRPMTAADVARVAAIEAASFRTPWSEASFRHELDIPFSRALVASPGDDSCTIAGYVVLWRVADEIHLLDVAVEKGFRRQGLGRRLTLAVLDEAVACAAALVSLEVAQDNQAARELYEDLGFRVTQVRRDYYGAGIDALVMEWRSTS